MNDHPKMAFFFLLLVSNLTYVAAVTDAELEALEKQIEQLEADEKNIDIIGYYHSHVYSQAYPSTTDIKEAIIHNFGYPEDYHYILISLVEKTRPVMRAFKIHSDESVEEEVIRFDGDQYKS